MNTKPLALPLCFVLLITLFISCTNISSPFNFTTKNEAGLIEDLLLSDLPLMDGGEITNLSIIKRLTNDDARTDDVYVTIEINYEVATEKRSYHMHYTRYNDGWHIDSTEAYHESDATWDLIPKSEPSGEFIIQILKDQFEEMYSGTSNTPSTKFFSNEMGYTAQIESDGIFFSQPTLSAFCNYTVTIDYITKYGYVMTSRYKLCFEFSNYTKEWRLYFSESPEYQEIHFDGFDKYYDYEKNLLGKADITFTRHSK